MHLARSWKRRLAGTSAVWLAGWGAVFGAGPAAGDPAAPLPPPVPSPVGEAAAAQVVYALGGARAPGIPWYDYTNRAGAGYFPHAARELIDYPAGAPFSWMPSWLYPGRNQDHVSIGDAARQATNSLDTAIRRGTRPAAAVGLSQGTLALDQEQLRLAHDPTAPPPDLLQFTTIGDPAFGTSFLSHLFAPGSYIPLIDYTMPQPVESQYATNRVLAAYDGLADFPDRPDNLLADLNAGFGAGVVHTPAAFTGPGDVPRENIRTTVNSRGATTTTYLIPVQHLPLTLPLRFLGWSDRLVGSSPL